MVVMTFQYLYVKESESSPSSIIITRYTRIGLSGNDLILIYSMIYIFHGTFESRYVSKLYYTK